MDDFRTIGRCNLGGELDAANSRAIGQRLWAHAYACTGNLEVDCAQLTFVGSTGLQLLFALNERLVVEGRELILLNLGGAPRRVAEVTGLHEVIRIA